MNFLIDCAERGLIPDFLLRRGIRKLLRQRLAAEDRGSRQANAEHTDRLVREFSAGPLALVPERANEQHYEVPAELFELTLGPHLKYSCGYWPQPDSTLTESEEAALELTCQRADLGGDQQILELGCGWGSLTLWMAEHYPQARITAVSNSASQRAFILQRARDRGLEDRIEVLTADINEFATDRKFDRVVSVEMMEHVRNHRQLFDRIADWLTEDGKLFVHVFCHRELTYPFEDRGQNDWMSRYFFSGGIMPGRDLLPRYQERMTLEEQWDWDGTHYQRTSEAWLARLDENRQRVWPVLVETYGADQARRWWNRWRLFYLAVAELFGYDQGRQWRVAHYRFANAPASVEERPACQEPIALGS